VRWTHVFVDRPVFATVISLVLTIIGAVFYFLLPVEQYPEIAPPTIQVTATYPGASAEVVADTVATPLEQQINGIEGMLYLQSESTGDGRLTLRIAFAIGTDLDLAQVLVQNRVSIAEPRLPETVRRLGIDVRKSAPDLMMVVHILSPDGSRDPLFISNYARTQVVDRLARIDGVGEATLAAERAYSMRVWIDPDRARALELTAGEIVAAVRVNNVQVAAGALGEPPVPAPDAFQTNVETQGRLVDPDDFEDIVVKQGADGRLTRIGDVARVELGAESLSTIGYLDEDLALPILISQRPGSNALETAAEVIAVMDELAAGFPPGVAYAIVYNPTAYIQESIDAVYRTLVEALVLVAIVVLVFLKSWRAAIVPLVAIPVSLVGTFAVMAAMGLTLNNLSLFGLVLAIGIVVDDAIVVVENSARLIKEGFAAPEAARRTMDEVGRALVATSLVLVAVFVPAAFITGISGQFLYQFAVTISASTIISTIVSLTLSPALCALLLRPEGSGRQWAITAPIRAFNHGFDRLTDGVTSAYGALTARLVRVAAIGLVVYAGLVALTAERFVNTPTGFVPAQDQGYLITVVQLPPGASLERTDAVVREAIGALLDLPHVAHAVGFAGFDGATFTNAPNAGAIFTILDPFAERTAPEASARAVLAASQARLAAIQEANIFVLEPPPVSGIGTGGGWKLYVQDREAQGVVALEVAAWALIQALNQAPGLANVFTLYNTKTPRIFADIDRVRAEQLGVPAERVTETLEIYLGSAFVNDFNFIGRTYRVTAQADGRFRDALPEVRRYATRSNNGAMVPLDSVARFEERSGPYRVPRYNLFTAAEVQGATAPGISTGQAIERVEAVAAEALPDGFAFEWTELALQEKLAGNTTLIAFALSVVFVFLVLAALYESWLLPLSVILIVPMCLLAALLGVNLRGMDNNVLVQTGFIVLIALAAKNAILIVEFAKRAEDEDGTAAREAVIEAARTRLRPILMTSLAFILGVVPLLLAQGPGAELRQALGTAVFFGMIGVTLAGLLFTPIFYVTVRWLAGLGGRPQTASEQA
jgi:HAE1 family hydrophobic/amphiphilic exporter-1